MYKFYFITNFVATFAVIVQSDIFVTEKQSIRQANDLIQKATEYLSSIQKCCEEIDEKGLFDCSTLQWRDAAAESLTPDLDQRILKVKMYNKCVGNSADHTECCVGRGVRKDCLDMCNAEHHLSEVEFDPTWWKCTKDMKISLN
ncbi:DB module domain-containing protein [Ditylenchus destructor]|uniref:DB module domain-containing protein n=1 Tax=Ditylenchus destructor TaxID=166010 RepID=A0AAD4R3S7_9BILA|nr:DB module domain-containing protein [Ditylenchus destructor]